MKNILLFASFLTRVLDCHAGYLEVAPGVYSFNDNSLYTSVFVVTGDGVVAIDSMNFLHSKAMIEAVKEVTSEPIKYLIHTHNHWDHASGNYLWKDEGAELVANVQAVEWMMANPNLEVEIPDYVWEGDALELTLGDFTFEFLPLGLAHGIGMFAIFIPHVKFLYAADMVSPKRLPFGAGPDYNFVAWEDSLAQLLFVDWELAVHTHSGLEDPLPASTKDDMIEAFEYLQELRVAVGTALAEGGDLFTLPYTLKMPKYESWTFYNEFLPLNIHKVINELVLGPYPWRP